MRTLLALSLVVAACSAPPKKTVEQDTATDVAKETCCCKTNPLTSVDGMPVYENDGRMDCSSKQGTCVDEVQCTEQPEPEAEPVL